jgi:hypothetical protein
MYPVSVLIKHFSRLKTSVWDPDPHPAYVFGPPGSASGSASHKYGTDPDPDPDPSLSHKSVE